MKLYKSTIVIWSEFDPTNMELDELGREAVSGDAYCSKMRSQLIEDPEADPDWDGNDFFADDNGEGGPPYDAATATGMYDRYEG